MELMGEATSPLRTYSPFILLMQQMRSPLFAILVSAGFTAIVQSSSATTAVVIALASQGLVSLETGIALVLGANVGTCVTALLAAIGKPRAAVQTAFVHVVFNVAGVLIWYPLIPVLADFVRDVSWLPSQLGGFTQMGTATPRQIANAHTAFNLVNTILFLPFAGHIARFADWIVPQRVAVERQIQPRYLDTGALDTPDVALDLVRLELSRLGELAAGMVRKSLPAVMSGTLDDLGDLAKMDDDVDGLQGHIVSYLGQLSEENLLQEQTERLYDYMAVANYLENIADMVETDLIEAGGERVQAGVQISDPTQRTIGALHRKVLWAVDLAVEALLNDDRSAAQDVIKAKPDVTRLAAAVDVHLARRLVADEPDRMQAFRIESDIVENLRRIYYFAKRIAKALSEGDVLGRADASQTLESGLILEGRN
jgi:phosphate:Na+ symporter